MNIYFNSVYIQRQFRLRNAGKDLIQHIKIIKSKKILHKKSSLAIALIIEVSQNVVILVLIFY